MTIRTLITACDRTDLLKQTIDSLLADRKHAFDITIHEDGKNPDMDFYKRFDSLITVVYTGGIGQHASIEKFLENNNDEFYLHLEEDWSVINSYDWISDSIHILLMNKNIIKVLATDGTPHPCVHDQFILGGHQPVQEWGIIKPWQNLDSLWWCGFSWNPGITRLDLLKKFIPFPKWEQDLGLGIHNAGLHVAELQNKVFKHIGHERSTHHKRSV